MCRRRRIGNTRGMTLVEIVVALAAASILFLSMASIVTPIYRVYARTRANSDAHLVAGTVLDSIRATCANAVRLTAIDASNEPVAAGETGGALRVGENAAFTVSATGYLMFDADLNDASIEADLVLAAGVYNGKHIALAVMQHAVYEEAVDLTVTVTGEDGQALCTVTSTVRPMRAVLGTPVPVGP